MLNVKLISYTPNPEKVVAAAAKLCYSNSDINTLLDGLTPDKVSAFLDKLSGLGHSSPTEHVSFTFGIEGISRAFLAQMTRHRLASFSVQSQRYVRMGDDITSEMVVPHAIAEDGEAMGYFTEAMQTSAHMYDLLCHTLESKHTEELMIQGMDENEARAKASKMANEDARAVLPNASPTKMIVTMNARELNAFFKLRCCNRAQAEIHAVADEMLKLVYPIAPHLFAKSGPSCVCDGRCGESTMTCGDARNVICRYISMKSASV